MKILVPAGLAIVACLLGGNGIAAEPVNIGSRRELFIDKHLVETMTGAARLQLHRPRKTDDVFVHDTAWEGNRSMYHTVFRDGDIYRMYYRGSEITVDGKGYGIPYNVTCYAESRDGIHWRRPELGLVSFRGSTKNNIILSGEICHAFVPFKDTNPDCPGQHLYKAIVPIYKPTRGLHVYSSPDGIRWKPMSDKPVITTGYFDSQNLAFWDSVRRRYVGFHRALRGGPGMIKPPSHEASTKDVMTATSSDFLKWSEPDWLTYSGSRWTRFSTPKTSVSPYVQLYTNQVQPYHRAPHIYLGFPTRYVAGRKKLTDLNRRLSKSVEYFGVDYTDGGFMTSRDGKRFQFWDEAFIRPGPSDEERWVYGDNFQALGVLETRSGPPGRRRELSMYVGEGFWRQCRLRRHVLRLDGFVSVQAPLSGGEVLTRPLVFDGNRLELNFSTSAAGKIGVEIQQPDGRPIKGFALADCDELFGDSLDEIVSWHDNPKVEGLAGRPVRLRFVVRDADLFSFRFFSER